RRIASDLAARRGGERHSPPHAAAALHPAALRDSPLRPHHPLRRARLDPPRLHGGGGGGDRRARAGGAQGRRPRLAVPLRDPAVEVDVAVVGAGPGGSTLAALLAMRGLSVALIDRDTFPRDKLCGEFLSYDALPIVEALGIDLDGAPAIDRCRVVSRHRTYEFTFPQAARGVS